MLKYLGTENIFVAFFKLTYLVLLLYPPFGDRQIIGKNFLL